MCKYFSGIITEDGQVLWLPENPLNHEAIITANNLQDTELKNRKFVRFEITPKSTSELLKVKQRSELTHDLFVFRWDEEGTLPEWVEKDCATLIAKAWSAAEESWKIHLLFDNEFLQELREKGYIHMMWGTSKVGVMRETSKVGVMRGTSKVGVMYGTSQVGEMWETSQVGEMWETSQVGVMRGTSQVGEMRETSKVGVMYGTSQVGVMRETSKVGEMYGTSQVGVMRGTSKVGEMYGTSQVGVINSFASAVKNGILYLAKDVTVEKSGKVSAEA